MSRVAAPGRPTADRRAAEVPDGVDEHLVSLLAPDSFEADQYRALRHVVEQRRSDAGLQIVAITSPGVEEGKTTTALNLAGTLAEGQAARVLLVEADVRRSAVGRYLGLGHAGRAGLVDAILDPALTLEDAVVPCRPFNLTVLLAGHHPAITYDLLKSARLGELLSDARRRYDYIVLDAPPLVPVPDCRLIERWVDGFLVVVAAHRTPRALLEEALNVMDPAKVVGLVFNGDDRPLRRPYREAYGRRSRRRSVRAATDAAGDGLAPGP
ncbi:MAG: CpsD/CapB family tyrosine-protein kinase [Candidatus Rokubacteria bacterium]|nr:CpsD/CapB family tyrosine-protein kinase [Candidatus Rokubacteria bacterium]